MDKEARDAPDGPWPVPLPDPHARPRRIAAQDRLALCPLGPRGRARCGAVSGAGDEKISLSGSVYAEITDGRVSLDQLREMADQGEALPLLDGSGLVFGSFVIEAIDERHAGLMADGRPLRIDFAIDLLRVEIPSLPAQSMA
jgi:phage protein U